MNPIIVNKEPGTGSLFPICTFETLVLYTKIRNKELLPGSRFPVSSFEIFETFTQIRKKVPVPGCRFPIPDIRFPIIGYIFIFAASTLTPQYSLYADK